jgi:hypothetical protein
LDLLSQNFREDLEKKIKKGVFVRKAPCQTDINHYNVPEFLKHTNMYQPVFKTDMHNRLFGHSPNVAWESFVKELKSTQSQPEMDISFSRNAG